MELSAHLDTLYKDRATFKGAVVRTETIPGRYGDVDKEKVTYDITVSIAKEEWEAAARPTVIKIIL